MPRHRELTDVILSVQRLIVTSAHQTTGVANALADAMHAVRAYAPGREPTPVGLTAAQGRLMEALEEVEAELDELMRDFEAALEGIGDDAQLVNVDLQHILQRQQQTLQALTAVAKMLQGTALAIIRKID